LISGNTEQITPAGTISRLEPLLNGISVFILATIFLYWDASRAAYVLLSLAALVYIVKYRPRLPRDHRFYSWPIIVYFAATFISVAYDDFSDSGMTRLTSRFLLLLIGIPLVSLFYACFDSRRNLWTKFILASVTMGAISLVDILYQHADRAGGGHNEVVFGFIALVMTCIVMASYHRLKKVRFGKFYYFSGLLMGFCAMFLSGTRGAWIVAIAVVMISIIFYLDRYSLSKRIIIAIALILGISAGGLSIPLVQERIDNMVEVFTPYVMGEEQTEFNSLRYRVELWKAGWQIGMKDRIFGVGPGNIKKSLRAFAAENPELAPLGTMNHLHNQFMQTFATSGFVGLVSLIGLITCHLWIFTKYLGKTYSVEVRSLALAGFLLVVAYVIFSIPEVPFRGKQFLMIYAFSSASIWGCLLAALQQSGATDENRQS